ncbi:MAG: hypothetical protein K8J08_09655 [Thermoanaerobaculia bacterium]|nr:hypothetical protein [Thermoanaerobaculia bacterium]
MKIQNAILPTLVAASFLFIPSPTMAEPNTALGFVNRMDCSRVPNEQVDVEDSRRRLKEKLDAAPTQDPQALLRIFCSVPRWTVDERIFFSHAAFVGLTEANRNLFLDRLAAVDPAQVMEMAVDTGKTHTPAFRTAVDEQERRLVREIKGLSREQQLTAYLGEVPAAELMSRRDRKRVDSKRRARDLASDPAILENFDRIEDSWLVGLQADSGSTMPLFTNLIELVQLKVMVARNLRFRGLVADQQTVTREFHRIRSAREQFGALSLFAQRRTVFMADDQEWKWGKPIIGSEKHLAQLRDQGTDLSVVAEKSAMASTTVLGEVQESADLTLLLGGHGDSSTLELGGGLETRELARAFVERAASQPASAGPAILIAMTCKGHDFARGLLDAMHSLDPTAPKPIIIVPSEFGQPFLKYPSDPFLGHDLGLRGGQASTLGEMFGQAHIETSIYVTDENNIPMQVL